MLRVRAHTQHRCNGIKIARTRLTPAKTYDTIFTRLRFYRRKARHK